MKRILLLGLLTIAGASSTAILSGQVTPRGTNQVAERQTSMTPDQIILEEYKAVRAEIVLCLQSRVTIVSLGFAAIGVLLTGGVFALTRDDPHWLVSAIIIGFGLTMTSLYALDVWIGETQRLARASYHNCYLELKINRLFPPAVVPLEWEEKIRSDDAHYKSVIPFDKGAPRIFLVVSVISAVSGLSILLWGARNHHVVVGLLSAPSVIALLLLIWGVLARVEQLKALDTIWYTRPC